MVANLYFLNYNNYFNRMVKQLETIADYQPYVIDVLQNVNLWNPGDGMYTEQVVNWDNEQNPNYVLAETTDGNFTRWFVIEAERTRAGQYRMSLKRDVVADYMPEVLEAPTFIEKATPTSIVDPAIYNREDITFNQIKSGEYQLKDKSGVPWIVGYIPRDSFPAKDYPQGAKIAVTTPTPGGFDYEVENLSDYENYSYSQGFFMNSVNSKRVRVKHFTTLGGFYQYDDIYVPDVTQGNHTISDIAYTTGYRYNLVVPFINFCNGWRNNPTLMSQYNTVTGINSQVAAVLEDVGKVIHVKSTDDYFKISAQRRSFSDKVVDISPVSELGITLNNGVDKSGFQNDTPDYDTFKAVFNGEEFTLLFEQLTVTVSTTIPNATERYHLQDAPYDMFCIPYPKDNSSFVIKKNGNTIVQSANLITNALINLATEIGAESGTDTEGTTSGSGNLYDIQLLPYCPFRDIIVDDNTIDVLDYVSNVIQSGLEGSAVNVGIMLWCQVSTFSFNIPFSIPQGTSIEDKKVKSETDLYRLCSPNYNGAFDFDAQKNNGVNYIEVFCTYKPYSPYIQLKPQFNPGSLYGAENYADCRGLICGGDFSLPRITNSWAEYELSNRNYEKIFDRTIQSMEVKRDVERVNQVASILTGGLSGGSSGAILGGMVGAMKGGIAGGIAGGAASLAGGIADYALSEKLYQENLDYTKDMYGYQLGNIQAIPYSLSKVSAYNINNKIFPFIEFYTCTEAEKQALKDKLKYNGYKIGRVGKLEDYVTSEPSYIKGRVIRLEINDDYHAANEIKRELELGVYI